MSDPKNPSPLWEMMPPISRAIWKDKYRLIRPSGEIIDDRPEDTLRRVANFLAGAENVVPSTKAHMGLDEFRAQWASAFYGIMETFEFMPAGRIVAGAGAGRNVTLSNCLASDTLILTSEYGLIPIGEIAGEMVHVLDGAGDWVSAPINSFGEQPVATVTLRGGYNGRIKKTIKATAGHRWILADGSETTTRDLRPGQELVPSKRSEFSIGDPEYHAGVRHGIVYGDGSQRPKGEVYLRLCGDKAELLPMFGVEWNHGEKDGDTTVYLGRDAAENLKLKVLPKDVSPAYLTGFLRGWMATDGSVGQRQGILTCGSEELDWLRRYGAVAGMEVSFVTKLGDSTNYGPRNKTLFNVGFHRFTMRKKDFFLSKHRAAFEEVGYPWIVDSISDYGEPEPVFCPRVVSTSSVTLDLGIHTGQCYVMGTIPDSMEGIFTHLKEAALTMQAGGGIGYDFSTIRPKGAEVKGVGAFASGPLSFMDCWDAMCRTVMSAGSRRGAMMATMRCDHPDILDFITAKHDAAKLRNFNVSVLCTDAFMEAVFADKTWSLVYIKPPIGETRQVGEDKDGNPLWEYKQVRAKDLWDAITRNTYSHAEPGVIFIDRINRLHNLWWIDDICATNPCGEKAMGPYDSCLLGSVNLAMFVRDAFCVASPGYKRKARINFDRLREVVKIAIRLMDNVIDVNFFPLPAQAAKARETRQLGLGITGLADMLVMLGETYGSPEAAKIAEDVMREITLAAYWSSVEIANEKGSFPAFDKIRFLGGDNFAADVLPEELKMAIEEMGIRNSLLTSIAPTGTISLFMNNVSSGMEPIFAYSYTRKVLQPDGSKIEELVEDYAVKLYREGRLDDSLPSYFVSAQTLAPADHVRMQGALQKWVDSSISKTINCPEDISFEDFQNVYVEAWEAGCKGCTTYRPNDVTGSVLTAADTPKAPERPVTTPAALTAPYGQPSDAPSERPEVLDGKTYKIKIGSMEHAVYVTVTNTEASEDKLEPSRPFEVFISTKDPSHQVWMTALSRMISAIFRRPHDSSFVPEELKAVFDPTFTGFHKGRQVPSVVAAIGGVIEDHMRAIGYGQVTIPKTSAMGKSETLIHYDRETMKPEAVELHGAKGKVCPTCFSTNLKMESGCFQCLDCGNSKCG